jgi:hypothetical protein
MTGGGGGGVMGKEGKEISGTLPRTILSFEPSMTTAKKRGILLLCRSSLEDQIDIGALRPK